MTELISQEALRQMRLELQAMKPIKYDHAPLPDIAQITAKIIADMRETPAQMHEAAEQLKKSAIEAAEKAKALPDFNELIKQLHKDMD